MHLDCDNLTTVTLQVTQIYKLTVFTLKIQVCVCVLHEVQTGSVLESLQTHRPSQRRQDGNHSECHHEPVQGKERHIKDTRGNCSISEIP